MLLNASNQADRARSNFAQAASQAQGQSTSQATSQTPPASQVASQTQGQAASQVASQRQGQAKSKAKRKTTIKKTPRIKKVDTSLRTKLLRTKLFKKKPPASQATSNVLKLPKTNLETSLLSITEK